MDTFPVFCNSFLHNFQSVNQFRSSSLQWFRVSALMNDSCQSFVLPAHHLVSSWRLLPLPQMVMSCSPLILLPSLPGHVAVLTVYLGTGWPPLPRRISSLTVRPEKEATKVSIILTCIHAFGVAQFLCSVAFSSWLMQL